MSHDAREERVGFRRFLVGVRVERIAGGIGERRDVLEGDLPELGTDGVTDTQGGQRLTERVRPFTLKGEVPVRARMPHSGHSREHVG